MTKILCEHFKAENLLCKTPCAAQAALCIRSWSGLHNQQKRLPHTTVTGSTKITLHIHTSYHRRTVQHWQRISEKQNIKIDNRVHEKRYSSRRSWGKQDDILLLPSIQSAKLSHFFLQILAMRLLFLSPAEPRGGFCRGNNCSKMNFPKFWS